VKLSWRMKAKLASDAPRRLLYSLPVEASTSHRVASQVEYRESLELQRLGAPTPSVFGYATYAGAWVKSRWLVAASVRERGSRRYVPDG